MKNKKVKCQCDGLFARVSGLVMTLVGGLGLVLTFISNGANKMSDLQTQVQGSNPNTPAFDQSMSWEVTMMLFMSVVLIIVGIVVFIASRKFSEN